MATDSYVVDGAVDPCVLLGDDLGVLDALLRAIQRFAQPRLLDRLQQVVDRVDLEGADRVFVEGGDERDERQRPLFLSIRTTPMPSSSGICRSSSARSGLFPLDAATASLPDAASATIDDIVERAEQRGQERSRRPLVVGDDDAQRALTRPLPDTAGRPCRRRQPAGGSPRSCRLRRAVDR